MLELLQPAPAAMPLTVELSYLMDGGHRTQHSCYQFQKVVRGLQTQLPPAAATSNTLLPKAVRGSAILGGKFLSERLTSLTLQALHRQPSLGWHLTMKTQPKKLNMNYRSAPACFHKQC